MQCTIIRLESQIELANSVKTASLAKIDKSDSCCRLSKCAFMESNFFDIVGVHVLPWKLVMEKNELFLRNTKKHLEKKGPRFNRTIQQLINKQAGDPVGPGEFNQSERSLNVIF
jgi:hypothetical protein